MDVANRRAALSQLTSNRFDVSAQKSSVVMNRVTPLEELFLFMFSRHVFTAKMNKGVAASTCQNTACNPPLLFMAPLFWAILIHPPARRNATGLGATYVKLICRKSQSP